MGNSTPRIQCGAHPEESRRPHVKMGGVTTLIPGQPLQCCHATQISLKINCDYRAISTVEQISGLTFAPSTASVGGKKKPSLVQLETWGSFHAGLTQLERFVRTWCRPSNHRISTRVSQDSEPLIHSYNMPVLLFAFPCELDMSLWLQPTSKALHTK